MKSILKIQAYIFLVLTLVSLLLHKTIGLPIIILLGIIIGPFMAYNYPWDIQIHIFISIGFLLSIGMMGYGIKYRTVNRGRILFILGFWLWAFISLVYGLGTGT